MKTLSTYTNNVNNITYTTYQLENNVKVLHLLNPSTIDTDISLIFRAGSVYETEQKVPSGTAHFLEHMLLNPNDIFKTREEIDQYEMGNRDRAGIHLNAFTSRKYLYIEAHSNNTSTDRLLKRLESTIRFPKEIFSQQIEKERGIILAERARQPKTEKNAYIQSLRYLLKETPEFQSNILGEKDDIESINIDNLETYFNNRITKENLVIAIQSKDKLTEEIENKLIEISNTLPEGEKNRFREYKLKNKYSVEIFEDDRASGTFISLVHFKPITTNLDYDKQILENAFARLIEYLAFNILREQKSLLYDFSTFRSLSESFYHQIHGMKFTTHNSHITEILDEYYKLLTKDIFEFLDSEKGVEWLEDYLSSLIYPRTQKYDNSLAERNATQLLEFDELTNENTYREYVKDIKIEDIKGYIKELLDVPPHIWIETDEDKEDILEEIEESDIAKRYKA